MTDPAPRTAMRCPRCASPLEEDDSRFCPYCGQSLGSQTAAPEASDAASAPAADAQLPRCARHPDRATRQVCPRCGTFACGECMRVTRSGEALCVGCYERIGGTAPLPWERRAELGLFTAYYETTAALLLRPTQTFGRSASATGRWWDPLSYALLSCLVMVLAEGALSAVMSVAGLAGLTEGRSAGAAAALAFGGRSLVSLAVLTASLFVGSGVEHLALRLTGSRTNGYEATLRGYCFSFAPALVTLVPVAGSAVFFVWQIVCRVLAYRGLHETTGGHAATAVLLPWTACCALGIGLAAAISSLR